MTKEHRRPRSLCLLALVILAAAIVFILIQSDGAEAGGNGDYPPPTSGHWYINQPTNVWQEKIELRRSIYVYSSLSMNLVNLTFNCTYNNQFEIYVASTGSLTFTRSTARTTTSSRYMWPPPAR